MPDGDYCSSFQCCYVECDCFSDIDNNLGLYILSPENETKQPNSVEGKQQPVIEEKYRKSNVTEEECRRLAGELELLMQRDRLYVNPNLKIADLAAILNVSTYTLSYLFNQYLDKNYYDYLNDYRIEEFKRLVDKDEYSKYTLTALAELCGFSSRTSFFRYFKRLLELLRMNIFEVSERPMKNNILMYLSF